MTEAANPFHRIITCTIYHTLCITRAVTGGMKLGGRCSGANLRVASIESQSQKSGVALESFVIGVIFTVQH